MPVAVPRLKRRTDFLRAARSGRKAVMPGLILQVRETSKPDAQDSGDPTAVDVSRMRVGFTVSRKVGGAVERNRAKRRLRAVAGKILPEMARNGWDYVMIGRRATLDRSFALLERDLRKALEDTGTMKGKPRSSQTGNRKKPA